MKPMSAKHVEENN